MIKKLIFLLFVFYNLVAVSQYTDVINSNRPGFSESPYSVGSGIYQFESNFFFRDTQATPTFSNPQALGVDLHFRTCFFLEKLELNTNIKYENNQYAFKNIFTSTYRENKFGLSLAAKYLVFAPKELEANKEIRSWKKRYSFQWKQWIPHIAVYAGVNFFDPLSEYYDRKGTSPKVGVLLQHEFSYKYNFITNIYYDYITTDNPEFSVIGTGTYNFNERWSGFAEGQLKMNKLENQTNVGIGAAFLFNRAMQINASARATFQEDAVGFYTTVGVSYRINKHKDKFVELDEFGNKITKEKPIKYDENRSFFGRIFSKVGKIFKKKDKEEADPDGQTGEDDENSVQKRPVRKREKSVLDEITKSDEKEKKKKTKELKKQAKKEEKALKKAAKKKEKEQRRELKKKEKEQRALQKEEDRKARELYKEQMRKIKEEEKRKKEEEKLQKEIEELDKELEKEEKKIKEEEKKQEEEKQEEKKKED